MRLATRASFVGLAVATHAGAAPKAPGIAPTVTPVAPSVSIASIAKCDAARTLSFAVEKAAKGGDGSAARPFGSFGEALTSAAARSACKVTVTAGPGEYVEDVPIRLPHVVLASRSSERPIVRGTIHHAGGGLLELRSIDVARASGVAIRQSGGRLSMIGVRVNQTAAVSSEIDTGIGLWMSGGAEAFARISTFEDNAHNAIRAEGAGTRLWLTLGTVKKSGVHPLALARVRADPNAQNADIGAILNYRA